MSEEDWNAFDHFNVDPEDHLETLNELEDSGHENMAETIQEAQDSMESNEFNLFAWELAGAIRPNVPTMIQGVESFLENDKVNA